MPMMYVSPEGDRKVEFWKSGRGGERKEFVYVPSSWTDDDINDELEEWSSRYFQSSEFVRYGWNDEANFGSRK